MRTATQTSAPEAARHTATPARAPAPAPQAPIGAVHTEAPVDARFGIDFGRVRISRSAISSVGAPDDPYEQEADRVAAQVADAPSVDAEPTSSGSAPPQVQAKGAPGQEVSLSPPLAAQISQMRGGGQPLPDSERDFFEQRFGVDFSRVRVHNDVDAADSARALGANAYTVGSDVVFGKGQYSPGTQDGRRLMAHELTHVVQQGHGQALPAQLQRRMAPLVGNDAVQQARVHTGPEARQRAEEADAHAVTEGRDIYFDDGEYKPGTPEGDRLIAHEVTHVAQGARGELRRPAAKAKGGGGKGSAAKGGGKARGGAAAADPGFQKVVSQLDATAKKEAAHDPAQKKANEAQAAAQGPADEVQSQAKGKQVAVIAAEKPKAFSKDAFKAALRAKITETAPKTLGDVADFKKQNKAATIKSGVKGEVDRSKDQSQSGVKEKTQAAPSSAGIEAKKVTPLPPTPAGAVPKVDVKEAAPKPRPQEQVDELKAPAQELDQQMAEANVTDEQLAKSNEPKFQKALKNKTSAQAAVTKSPAEFRKSEAPRLQSAQNQAQAAAQVQLQGMHGERGKQLGQVVTQQQGSKSDDERQRRELSAELNKIYEDAKSKVEKRLKQLDTDVEKEFDKGADAAKQKFLDNVDRRVLDFKLDRYLSFKAIALGYGPALWIADQIKGMPPEVDQIYQDERGKFIAAMDGVLDRVAGIVEKGLNEALDEVKKGKQQVEEKVKSLPGKLKEIGREAADEIKGKFDDLEQSVRDKENDLVNTLAEKYSAKLKEIDSEIEKRQKENRGLIDKAKEAVGEVIETILKLKEWLQNTLARAASVIDRIIADPIGFVGNLVAGAKAGFMQFMTNIGTHLQQGLMGWLLGALGEAGIQLPTTFDLKGILQLVLQVLGLTWANIRARAVRIFGEPVVKALETASEIIKILVTEGPAGLWEHIKEQIGDLKSAVIDGIKDFVISKVITAGVTWVLGLLNPAGAFVKAVKAIMDIVSFFIERAAQIASLVDAVLGSLEAIVSGNIGAMAAKIEAALGKAVPVVIGFLASLLGVTGISQKIQEIIKKVRAPIEKAIDWVLKKAHGLAKKALAFVKGKLGLDKEDDPKAKEERLNKAVASAVSLINRRFARRKVGQLLLKPILAALKLRYRLTVLEAVQQGGKWAVHGVVNPEKTEVSESKAGGDDKDPLLAEARAATHAVSALQKDEVGWTKKEKDRAEKARRTAQGKEIPLWEKYLVALNGNLPSLEAYESSTSALAARFKSAESANEPGMEELVHPELQGIIEEAKKITSDISLIKRPPDPAPPPKEDSEIVKRFKAAAAKTGCEAIPYDEEREACRTLSRNKRDLCKRFKCEPEALEKYRDELIKKKSTLSIAKERKQDAVTISNIELSIKTISDTIAGLKADAVVNIDKAQKCVEARDAVQKHFEAVKKKVGSEADPELQPYISQLVAHFEAEVPRHDDEIERVETARINCEKVRDFTY